jgi:hypothetical protein
MQKSGLPLLLAQRKLLNAEASGLLCRDDSGSDLRFFPNRFPSFVTSR